MSNWFDVTLVAAGAPDVVDSFRDDVRSILGESSSTSTNDPWFLFANDRAADGRLRVDFALIWGPPHSLVQSFASDYPGLRLVYIWSDIGGCDIAGRWIFEGGELIAEDQARIEWRHSWPTEDSIGLVTDWMTELAWPADAVREDRS